MTVVDVGSTSPDAQPTALIEGSKEAMRAVGALLYQQVVIVSADHYAALVAEVAAFRGASADPA